jgi:hypothetical protein
MLDRAHGTRWRQIFRLPRSHETHLIGLTLVISSCCSESRQQPSTVILDGSTRRAIAQSMNA